uniref:Uncharacterized protein n=1 Tax=Anguilla anguilla TaxID=7936 RepID=A0A0E9V596_ANGAN
MLLHLIGVPESNSLVTFFMPLNVFFHKDEK